MAIAVVAGVPKKGFILNATSADLSGGETILAGVTDKQIVVRHMTISNSSVGALTVTVGGGVGAGAVTTPYVGPVSLLSGQSLQWTFHEGLWLVAAVALCCDASGAGEVLIFVQGTVE